MKELQENIKQKNHLYDELRKRPFEIKAVANRVNPSNHPELTNTIISKIKNKERFYAKIRIEGERLWCIVIGRIDSHNANFDDKEEGQIFAGILDSHPVNEKISFNDLVEFQSSDVYEIRN